MARLDEAGVERSITLLAILETPEGEIDYRHRGGPAPDTIFLCHHPPEEDR